MCFAGVAGFGGWPHLRTQDEPSRDPPAADSGYPGGTPCLASHVIDNVIVIAIVILLLSFLPLAFFVLFLLLLLIQLPLPARGRGAHGVGVG